MPGSGTHIRQRAGISVSDFHDALNSLWLRLRGPARGKLRFAIAVSGGVDSMALATLCAMLGQYPLTSSRYHPFTAFVVDHKAREGSRREAIEVVNRLKRLGIYSRILSLDWPPQVQPLKLSDFETQARRLRYQALGAACSAQNISRLLIAHHADDQAETVLTRLSTGHKSIGLRGINAYTQIPECWGIHGVHRSGGYESALAGHHRRSSKKGHSLHWDSLGQRNQKVLSSPPLVEFGGVRIMRPLLKFRKQDLIDTCQAHGVAWSEDATNQDTWRTSRNATRSLLGNFRLPMALGTTSLVRLSSRMEVMEIDHNRHAAGLNDLCQILLFDLQSGSVVVRLPKQSITEGITKDAAQGEHPASWLLTASLLIRKLTRLVTPYEAVPLHSLKRAVIAMFPIREHSIEANVEGKTEYTKFTAAGVLFERINSPLPDTDVELSSDAISYRPLPRNQKLDINFIWSLTRQPFANISADVKVDGSEKAPNTILIDRTLSCNNDTLASSSWSSWHLWDGRYWIRIKNLTNQLLKLRPFHESDLQTIRTRSPKLQRKQMEELLASIAPNKVRWTLPVIANAVEEERKLGEVFVLPTLGKTGIIDVGDDNGQKKVEWEVRYKSVDLGRSWEDSARRKTDIVTSWEDS